MKLNKQLVVIDTLHFSSNIGDMQVFVFSGIEFYNDID